MSQLHANQLRNAGGVVLFSPMPPLANGIADYTAELLPALARQIPVVVVVDDRAPAPAVPPGCTLLRLQDYLADEARLERLPHLYQLGNNPDHVYMLPVLLRHPGVVVLHDVSLHHLVDQATLRWGDEAAYADWLELEYGHAGRTLARQFSERRWRPRSMFYELPMTREILTRARAVITHSLYAATRAQAQALETPVRMVRHHLAPSALAARRRLDRGTCRSLLGVPQDATLLVSLGFVTRAKQIETVLRDLARRVPDRPDLRYVIAGQDEPEHFDVRALVASLGLQDVVHITGYVDEDSFYRWIAASDIVVNLRYPSGGETSGTLIRALGMGACVVVNDLGPFAEYPDGVCAKVPMDDPAQHERCYAAVLDRLIDAPPERQRLAQAAANHMAATHALERSVSAYIETLARYRERPVPAQSRSTVLQRLPAAVLNRRIGQLPRPLARTLPWWLASGEMPAFDTKDDSDARLLCVGMATELIDHVAMLYGYPSERIDVVAQAHLGDALPLALRRRTLSAAIVRLENVDCASDLRRLLTELNGLMRLDGRLLLVLEPADERSLAPDAVRALRARLERQGFRCRDVSSGRHEVLPAIDAHAVESLHRMPRSGWLFVAEKVSEFMPAGEPAGWPA